MKHCSFLVLFLAALRLSLLATHPVSNVPHPSSTHLKFIENAGQWPETVQYRADLPGGRVWLREGGFSYAFQDQAQLHAIHERYYHGDACPQTRIEDEIVNGHNLLVDFLGANPNPDLHAEGDGPGYYNFFLGQDPSKWKPGLKAHDKVVAKGIYPGIDLHAYSKGAQFKYDFVLEPGADPALVRLSYSGQDALFLDEGRLHIATTVGEVVEMAPFAYQIQDGEVREVACAYVLEGNVLSFDFPEGYDPARALVIDPTLVAATYSGSTAECYGHTATYDDAGNIYSGGICFAMGFPTNAGSFQSNFGGLIDQAINKYSPDASALIWSTYIGGSDSDFPHSLVVNDQDELIVLGTSSSSDFPISASAVQPGYQGGASDIVVTHLTANAQGLIGSTFLGGINSDGRNPFSLGPNYGDSYRGEILVDDQGDIYIGSVTESPDFPSSPNAFQTTFGGLSDGVLVKLNPDLSSILWCTFIGGPDDDNCNGIKFTSNYEVYFTGTGGTGLPATAGAFQTTPQGSTDAYIGHLDASGQSIVNFTYSGTGGDDYGYFLELDAAGDPYILGQSASYPVSPNVYSQTGGLLFVQKLDQALSTSAWSTTMGSTNSGLSPTAFLVDNCGNIYFSAFGTTTGLDVTPDAYDPLGGSEFYIAVLEPNATGLLYATNFGTNFGDHVDGGTCRFDKRGAIYESVCTSSNNWPTTPNAVFPTDPNPGYDVTCFKFEFNFTEVTAAFAPSQPANGCAPFPLSFNNTSTSNASTNYFWDFGDGNTSVSQNPSHTYLNPGNYTVTLIVSDSGACNGMDTATAQVTVGAQPPITVSLDTTTCLGAGVELETIFVPGATYDWSPGNYLSDSTTSNPIASPPGTTVYTLIVTDQFGCADTADITVNVFQIESDAGPAVSFCEGEGGAQLTAGMVSGGVAPYYYTWWCNPTTAFCGLDSTFDDDPIANPDTTTWYYVQITDGSGCIGTVDSALVEVLPKPIVDAGPDAAICQPPSPGTLLSASVLNGNEAPGPYTIAWFPAAGLSDPASFTPYARPDTSTIYTAIVASSNGCNSQATTLDTPSTITVTVHPQPVADAGPEIHLCYGDTASLEGLGYGAGPVYDFEWSPISGLSDSSVASPLAYPSLTTEYTLTVWSNGCPSFGDPVTVWVHTLPTPSAGNIQDICLGESAQLDAFADGDSSATYSYEWWPAASLDNPSLENPIASPDTTTWYYLVATSSWGCKSAPDSMQVTVIPSPIAEAGPDLQLCAGDSLQLQGGYLEGPSGPADPANVYFTWTPVLALSDPGSPQPWAWPGQSGWYHLQVSHSVCASSDSVLVTVNPAINPVVYADTNVGCAGDSIQLHASGGLGNAGFQWSPATGLSDPYAAEPWAAPNATTTYTLLAQEGGCEAIADLTIEVIPLPEVSYLTSLREGCAPFTVSFLDNSANAQHYVWDFGDGSPVQNTADPVHTYDHPGSYTVALTGINAGGCAATISPVTITVGEAVAAEFALQAVGQPQLNAAPIELFMPSSEVAFEDMSSPEPLRWTWDFGDGGASAQQDPQHRYTEEGVYMVTLTVQNELGCVSKAIHGPIVVVAPELFIPNVFSPNGDGVNDAFWVEYGGSQPFLITIYDRWGVQLYSSRNKRAPWKGLDAKGQAVPEGTYYYHLSIGDREFAGDLTLLR